MVIVRFDDNYADEFDVCGFSFYESKEAFLLELYKSWLSDYFESEECSVLEEYLKANKISLRNYLNKATINDLETYIESSNEYYSGFGRDFSFGTNESIMYESFEDYKKAFSIKEVTNEEYQSIKKLLGEEYGVFLVRY